MRDLQTARITFYKRLKGGKDKNSQKKQPLSSPKPISLTYGRAFFFFFFLSLSPSLMINLFEFLESLKVTCLSGRYQPHNPRTSLRIREFFHSHPLPGRILNALRLK